MKILLTAINAKFIHSSLAVRSLLEYSSSLGSNIEGCEYTINNSEDYILADIYKKQPSFVAFSCYIWNIGMVLSLAQNLKKIIPSCQIICGGPEVSYESEEFLKNNSQIDIVIRGEGEKTFFALASALINGISYNNIKGITIRNGSEIISNPPMEPMAMDDVPFMYSDLSDLKNKIIYYETQRGCPYNCQFCLSSVEKGVRFLSIEKVLKNLDFFLENKVRQVKFVDRTFNCNKAHANAIWKYLIDNDNGITNFHMEIEGHIIDDDTIKLLSHAREGLFQFEIGIQSTNPHTLEAVKRNPDFEPLKEKIQKIQVLKNIHIHLDLIAGLPYEGYASFKNSFNDVYSLMPNQLQLGFLKLLKGSGLKACSEKYGIVCKTTTPYEVLFTNDISFNEMLRLKGIEELTETYYNSGKAVNTVKYMARLFETPFDFYEKFSIYWENNNLHRVNHSKAELYTILYEFAEFNEFKNEDMALVKDILKYDMLLSDNLNGFPAWLAIDSSEEFKKKKRSFYSNAEITEKFLTDLQSFSPSQLNRMCIIEKFALNPIRYCESGNIEKGLFYVLFNYHNRDLISNHAETKIIEV